MKMCVSKWGRETEVYFWLDIWVEDKYLAFRFSDLFNCTSDCHGEFGLPQRMGHSQCHLLLEVAWRDRGAAQKGLENEDSSQSVSFRPVCSKEVHSHYGQSVKAEVLCG